MTAYRMGLLCFSLTVSASTVAFAADSTPQLEAVHQLGQQNITSIASHSRMGGPQGISVNELPAAAAHRDAQRVDAIHAVRAGSTRPIPNIQLAHPSHVVGVPGSRPFVSDGPISRSPGTRRRVYRPYPHPSTPQMSSQPSYARPVEHLPVASQPVAQPRPVASPVKAMPAPIFSSVSAARSLFPGVGGRL